jgi:hypothetical protein
MVLGIGKINNLYFKKVNLNKKLQLFTIVVFGYLTKDLISVSIVFIVRQPQEDGQIVNVFFYLLDY